MKILCCGDRHWTNKERIREILISYPSDTVVIEGEASGADKLCKEVAKSLGMTVIPVPADWNKYGKAAGPIRNKLMLDMGPVEVIAFHNDFKNSKGTKNCIMQARQRGIRTLVITEKEDKVSSLEQLSHVLDGMTPEQIKGFDEDTKRRPLFGKEKEEVNK